MKKNLLLIILPIIMSISITIQSTAQGEFYGKWVLPIVEDGSLNDHQTLILSFFSNQISDITVSNPISEKYYCQIAAGAYNPNYDLDFYINDNTLLYDLGNQSFVWDVSAEYYLREEIFKPEFQIIPKPGDIDSYFMFYSEKDHAKTLSTYFRYSEIWYENGWHVSEKNNIIPGNEVNSSLSFAISDEDDGERKLYTSSVPMDNSTPEFPAGLRKWEVDQSGVGEMMEIVMAANSDFEIDDFSAHNLELKTENNGDDVIAWISTNPLSLEKVFIVIDGNEEYYDLGFGRIGGIEFSSLDPDVLYVSCPEEGIIKIDYTDGNYISTLVDSENFGHTFLQTAPDGHIYAVSDDGRKLGQINMQTGIFDHDYYSVPDPDYIVSAYRLFDNTKYFILPENDREYCPLTATVELQHVCPGQCYGEAWIDEDSITCGHGPYTYIWYDDDNQVIGNSDHIYDLCEGIYRVEMQDSYGLIFEEEFVITVDPDYYDHDWYIVKQDEEWLNFELSFWRGIRIKAGFELELINSHLKFLKPGKIIIEQGARLIADHSTLTYYPECDVKWQGIEVLGDGTQHQYTINDTCYQGYLELKNNSEVSYSENAVSLYKTTIDSINIKRIIYWDSCGGIVRSTNTNFLNNTRAVHFIPYSNFNPYQVDMQMDNLSHFIKDTFDINLNNIGDSIFYKHADLHGVKGIDFHGCTFTKSDTNFVSHWNFGIAAYGAGFAVKAVCTEPMVPCPPSYTIPSTFDGFFWAVAAYNSLEYPYTFRIFDAEFQNNNTGIFVSGVDFGVIINCDFEVGHTFGCSSCGIPQGFGIDVHHANGFAIENNIFTKYNLAATGEYAGIRVLNCPSLHDIILNNDFNGLSFGNFAQGENRSDPEDDLTGVEYQCNTNINNAVDFIVADDGPIDAKIRNYQGNRNKASGNTFSQPPDVDWHFINEGTEVIDLYYYIDLPLQLQVPDPYLITTDYVNPIEAPENNCLDHYTGEDIKLSATERQNVEIDYAQNLSDYNAVLSQYESLEDGGSTPNELTSVQTAQPDDMWTLRAQLLGDSPHLSQEILMETSDRTDVFPDDALFDILAANPDELKEDTLLSYLENKQDPLPAYMIDILRQLGLSNTTYKTILLNELAEYHSGKTHAAQDIIRSIIHDSTLDLNDYRNWMDNLGGLGADKQIITSYLNEGDTASATSLLNMIPGLYNLQGEELDDYTDYQTLVQMQIYWNQAGKSIFELDNNEILSLETYAYGNSKSAKYLARNILSYAYNYNFYECMQVVDSNYFRSANHSQSESLSKSFGPKITAEPNPASTWAAFNYQMYSDESIGYIIITDIAGKKVKLFNIVGKEGQVIWDTRWVKSSMYIYTITSNGLSESGKIIVK